jgi:hypothetical protein
MLSEYCREIREKYNISVGGVGKLVTTLNGKEKYVVHSRNLQLYIKPGLKVNKNTQSNAVQPITMARGVHRLQH